MATVIQKLWSIFKPSFSDNNPPTTRSIFHPISILSFSFYRKSSHNNLQQQKHTLQHVLPFTLSPPPSSIHLTLIRIFIFPLHVYSQNISCLIYPSLVLHPSRTLSFSTNRRFHLITESTSKSAKFQAQRYQSFSTSLHLSMPANLPYEAHAQRSSWHTIRIKRSEKTDSSFRRDFP